MTTDTSVTPPRDAGTTGTAGGTLELRVGGAVRLEFRHAELTYPDDPPPPKYADMADEFGLLR